jgi:hypothetical protein
MNLIVRRNPSAEKDSPIATFAGGLKSEHGEVFGEDPSS